MRRYDTAWKRIGASLVDGLVFLPLLPFLYYCSLPQRSPLVIASASIFWFLLSYSYFVFSLTLFGRTFGKKLLGVKVLDAATRSLPSLRQAVLRISPDIAYHALELGYLLYLVIMHRYFLRAERYGLFADIIGWLNGLWLFADVSCFLFIKRHRATHDFIAGTIVIRLDTPAIQRRVPDFHKSAVMDV
jgi:uncharacterized RDD family membrane protein YckC